MKLKFKNRMVYFNKHLVGLVESPELVIDSDGHQKVTFYVEMNRFPAGLKMTGLQQAFVKKTKKKRKT